jgi:hypothetical protein
LGIGDWGLGPIPNPQSPIPNPQSPIPIFYNIITKIQKYKFKYIVNNIFIINQNLKKNENNIHFLFTKFYSSKNYKLFNSTSFISSAEKAKYIFYI